MAEWKVQGNVKPFMLQMVERRKVQSGPCLARIAALDEVIGECLGEEADARRARPPLDPPM